MITHSELADRLNIHRQSIRVFVQDGLIPPPILKGRRQFWEESVIAKMEGAFAVYRKTYSTYKNRVQYVAPQKSANLIDAVFKARAQKA